MSRIVPEDFHAFYKEGRTPWDTGRPDHNLVAMVEEGILGPGRLLDIGCGSGTDAIWLASHGFEVTGIDLVEAPLTKARKKDAAASGGCRFLKTIFPGEEIPGSPFALAYDRGCFHSQGNDAAKKNFAGALAENLVDRGLWLSLVGSCDDPDPTEPGPPRLTAVETTTAVEPFFEVELMRKSHLETNQGGKHQIWVCLFRKR